MNTEPPKLPSVSKRLLKTKLAIAGVTILTVIGFICAGIDRGNREEREAAEKAALETELVETAPLLFAAYDRNEVYADATYTGKWVRIFGRIEVIKKDIFGSPYIALAAHPFFSVQCMLADSAVSDAVKLRPGIEVVILGKVQGKTGNVIVRDCRISEVGQLTLFRPTPKPTPSAPTP